MSMFPVTVMRYSGRAEPSSGGEDYHLVKIATAEGRYLVINRWAKAGQWGSGFSCVPYESEFEATTAWNSKFREKMEGKYRDKLIDTTTTCTDLATLKRALGQYWSKIGLTNLSFVGVPEAEAAGSRAQESVEWEGNKRSGFTRKEKPPLMVEEAKPTADDEIVRNPNWGLF